MTRRRTDTEFARAAARDWSPQPRRSVIDSDPRYLEFVTAFMAESIRLERKPSATACYNALRARYPEFPLQLSALQKWMTVRHGAMVRGGE